MPDLTFQVPEFNISVLNHVAYQVVQAMMRDLTLTALFDDSNTTVRSDHLADADSSDGTGGLRVSGNRCDVVVNEVTNPARIRWDMLNFSNVQAHGQSLLDRADMLPLFRDHTADITLWEYGKPCNLRLEFTLKFRDKAEAMRVESVITNRYHASSVHNPHDIAFAYPLGLDLAAALFALYKLRTSYNGDKAFVTYLREFAAQAIAFEVGKPHPDSAAMRRLVIKHIRLQALGLLEYDQEKPTPLTLNQTTDRWELQFVYTLQFARPDTLRLAFPTVVENQWVPAEVLPSLEPDSHLFLREMEGLLRRTSFNHAMRQVNRRPEVLVRLPYYDRFYPQDNRPTKAHGYKPFLIAAFTLDQGGTTIDLQNLGEVELDATARALMVQHGHDIFTTLGLFNISVYVNGVLMAPTRLSIDDELKLTVQADDPLKRYHLVLSETTEINQINGTYLKLLLQHRWYFAALIARHLRDLNARGYLRTLPSAEAYRLVQQLLYNRDLESYLEALITDGHATLQLWQMTTSPYQLLEYLLATQSRLTTLYLYDVLLQRLLEDDVIPTLPAAPLMKTHDGLPLHRLMEKDGYGYSTPFRVALVRLAAQ